jgi:hypothetical protein
MIMTTTAKQTGIPSHLWQDRYWRGTLHLFVEQPKLRTLFNSRYFDLENGDIQTEAMKRATRPWSPSERFLLNLALHLFNERHKLNLSDIDLLDHNNKQLALKAIQLRFS